MRKILALVLSLLWAAPVSAQIIGTLPFTLQNGSIADANQVMADLNTIVAAVNANSASAGANGNITALNGLTTPLVYTSGGTSNYIGGTSSGSANAQIIASPIPSGFSLITGKSVTFTAGFNNTGATTLTVAGTAATNVFRQTASVAVAMVGGEIVLGQLYTAVFDGTQFQIQGASPQSSVQPCTVIDWTGVSPPSGYILAGGAAVSRTTFAALFSCLAVQGVAATTTSGSTSVVVPNSALFQVGWSVGGNNVTCNSGIAAIPDGTHITLGASAGATGATTLTIGPYPQGDCSTTFNVPSLSGRATMMRDISGSVLTVATCALPATQGFNCGAQIQTLTAAQIPSITSNNTVNISVRAQSGGANIPVTNGTITTGGAATGVGNPSPATSGTWASVSSLSDNNSISVASNNTGGQPHPLLNPVALVDKYIKF